MDLQSKENRNKNERQMENWGNICSMSEKWLKSFIHTKDSHKSMF